MLRWRLILGTLLIATLVGLCWLDLRAAWPGTYLFPIAIAIGLAAASELMNLLARCGHRPLAGSVYAGTLLIIAASWMPALPFGGLATTAGQPGWWTLGFMAAILTTLWAAIVNFAPGGDMGNRLAVSLLVITWTGGLTGFIVTLRVFDGPPAHTNPNWGMLALLSTIAVVKSSDTGAYFTGRLCGRHKMAPTLSPGKTWEGLAGGLAMAVAAALLMLGPVAKQLVAEPMEVGIRWLAGGVLFGLAVAVAGVLGDLVISLLKRDSGVKDSSTWLPGFGGVLDIVDSLLVAAPVAYACWQFGLVGR